MGAHAPDRADARPPSMRCGGSSPRGVIGGLARIVHDIGWAEDLAQDALVAALEQWPQSGIPDNPGAWLMATAKHRAIDQLRRQPDGRATPRRAGAPAGARAVHQRARPGRGRRRRHRRRHAQPAVRDLPPDALGAGPGGADAAAVRRSDARPRSRARSWSRRRRSPSASCGPSARWPRRACRWRCRPAPSSGPGWPRCSRSSTSSSTRATRPPPARTGCARRCARTRCGWDASWPSCCPREAEVHGLVALMEIQASRSRARVGPDGEPVLLLDQDRSRWDRVLIGRGLRALARAEQLGGALGPYALQAAIAACHARAATADQTDWGRIVALYDALAQLTPSPVVELNRAVAVSMAYGPEAALELVDALVDDNALGDYHLLPSVRADLLARLGRVDEARAELERAAGADPERVRAAAAQPARGRPRSGDPAMMGGDSAAPGSAGTGGANSPTKSAAASGSPSTRSAPSLDRALERVAVPHDGGQRGRVGLDRGGRRQPGGRVTARDLEPAGRHLEREHLVAQGELVDRVHPAGGVGVERGLQRHDRRVDARAAAAGRAAAPGCPSARAPRAPARARRPTRSAHRSSMPPAAAACRGGRRPPPRARAGARRACRARRAAAPRAGP